MHSNVVTTDHSPRATAVADAVGREGVQQALNDAGPSAPAPTTRTR